MTSEPSGLSAGDVAAIRDRFRRRNHSYHAEIARLLRRFVKPGSSVLEIGASTGGLLADLSPDPETSLGVDRLPGFIDAARRSHAPLKFEVADAMTWSPPRAAFDAVVASDVLGSVEDVQTVLERLRPALKPGGRLLVTAYNFLWRPVLRLAERSGVKMPEATRNWLSRVDLEHLLFLSGYRIVESGYAILLPWSIPGLSRFVNRIVPRVPGLKQLCLVHFFVAAPAPEPEIARLAVSVVIPCRNEVGNIAAAVARVPGMGRETEILFVDGASTDGTIEEIENQIRLHPERRIRLIHQVAAGESGAAGRSNRMLKLGKGDAVRKGFAAASGDILMILDADLTVEPESLPRFYDVLAGGLTKFANGTRLVYPLEEDAMKLVNLAGNRFFSAVFSWLIGQPVRDTLCGTKVLFRSDYERILANRSHFGDFDPFGDFDLLFGAAWIGLSIVDVPIHYRRRVSGESKVSVALHGPLLMRMAWYGFRKLKLSRRPSALESEERGRSGDLPR